MSSEASRAIEAVLMVAQEPVEPQLLAQLLEVSPARVAELCAELQDAYGAEGRGFVLVKVAGGYRFQSHPDLAAYVERFVLEGQHARLSSAALETLAIVAYKQPLSRAQVAAIRGVNVDGVIRTLQQRGYIDEVGRDSGPGQATLFGTTPEFLERLGLDRIEDLPSIQDLFPTAEVMEALERGLLADASRARATTSGQDDEPEPETESPGDGREEALDLRAAGPAPTDLDERPEPVPPAWARDDPPSVDRGVDEPDGPDADAPPDVDLS